MLGLDETRRLIEVFLMKQIVFNNFKRMMENVATNRDTNLYKMNNVFFALKREHVRFEICSFLKKKNQKFHFHR